MVKTVEAAMASRAAAAPAAPTPVVTGVRDLQMDPPEGRLWQARAGVAIKIIYLDRAKALGVAKGEHFQRLEQYVTRCKAVGAFASIFGQGGERLPVVESAEIIEFLKGPSLLVSRPGLRKASGYGGKFVVGRQNERAVVYWAAEGEPVEKTEIKHGLMELGAHKAVGRVGLSNDLMRRGDSSASADVGAELQQEMALLFDKAGLFGKGNKQPLGILEEVEKEMISEATGALSDTDATKKLADLDSLPAALEKKKHKLDDSAFYFMPSDTFWHLRGLRDASGWVFEGLRDLKNPTINGFPVERNPELLFGWEHIGFGLASQLYFGSAAEMEMTIGENASDFVNDMQTLRVVGYADWKLRHTTAFAFKKKVKY
ncbi:phage major capsid protein [Archangium violaceum]|uniref:phage major capsid protein n=1 Tax=Archangium violaceum TaxID=83451 RepID=UPI00193B7F07|nr:phage major capsid protein [Archangium violaceum]QRK06054.1 phage major capsid protein [Archangium violaceum]QRK08071.1 phage major capsid protein [Archangium violaceum]